LLTANLLLHLNTFVPIFRTAAKSPFRAAGDEALYPRKMPSAPAHPPSPERPQSAREDERSSAAPSEQGRAEREREERSGPLTITRVRKDDGRSLILYGHDETQAELDDATAHQPQRMPEPQRADEPQHQDEQA
jgi:hypothetical protein